MKVSKVGVGGCATPFPGIYIYIYDWLIGIAYVWHKLVAHW